MRTTEIIEKTFTENQIEVIKATIKHGMWGNCSQEMANGETKEAWGFCTEDAKNGIQALSNRQIAGIYSGIVKTIKENEFDFMNHATDWWERGRTSDGMLFISDDVVYEVQEWANK